MVNNIATLRVAKGWTMAQLADAIGTDASTINKLEKGKYKLTADYLSRIANALETRVDNLILPAAHIKALGGDETGDDNAIVASSDEHSEFHRRPLVRSYDPDADDESGAEQIGYTIETWRPSVKGGVPEVDMKLGAGSGTVSGEILNVPVGKDAISAHPIIAEWVFPETYLRNELKVGVKSIIIEEIIGDSMSPTYLPGDKVIVDLAQNRLVSDTVYAISDGYSEPQIKRLQRVPFSNPAQVIIISDNPNLQKFTVELEQLRIIGRVAGVVSRR